MSQYGQKLQDLLRELFQFDSVDLDFGIYAVMNHKRAEVERFIEHDLLDAIAQGLQVQSEAHQARAQEEFDQARQKLQTEYGDSVEQNNVKGDRRFFVLAGSDPVAWDAASRTLTIGFEYRSLSADEHLRAGSRDQQDKLNGDTSAAVLRTVADPLLKERIGKLQGESALPDALPIEAEFKRLMFEGVS